MYIKVITYEILLIYFLHPTHKYQLHKMANEQSGFEAGDVIYREMDGSAGKSTNYTTSNKIGFHYGVYIGDDTVIDFSGEFGVRKCSLDKFAAGLEVSKEK